MVNIQTIEAIMKRFRGINDRLLICSCDFHIVRLWGHDHVVQAQNYARLTDEPIGDRRVKTIIEVYRYYEKQKPELVAALRHATPNHAIPTFPVFVSVLDENYKRDRVVFIGESGLGRARYFLDKISKLELATALDRMFRSFMVDDDD